MNKILTMVTIILSMILTTNLSFGQSNFKKGNKFVEGSVNYSKVNNTTQSSLNLSGAHFFTNRFALGLTGAMSESKTPFLGDIPYLGRLFKRTKRSSRRAELLIFITPKILEENFE